MQLLRRPIGGRLGGDSVTLKSKLQPPESEIAIVVPHTHWDREWRYPIWKNRVLLRDFMQQLLEILERDEEYACFVTDGQCVLIEDYLEICPEDENRIRAQVEAGRLRIGPWYTLPDLYPLDGECLVRNLLKGIRVSDSYGGHLGVGYNSFGWGQTAQFPQIYKGFGVDFLVAAKRVSKERAPNCEFWWEGPDGTRLLTSRLGKDARANGFFQAYIPVRFGIEYMSPEYRFEWGKTGQVMHRADEGCAHEDYFRIDAETGYHADKASAAFDAAWHAMDETLMPDCRLILCGSDFSTPQPILTKMIRDANAAHPEREIRTGTLEEYGQRLHAALAAKTGGVPIVRGELRDGPSCSCSGNALATRIHIKQLNKQVENALIRRTEPLTAALSMLDEPYPKRMLDRAWTYVLKAHPHDSINGVTQDKTADDTVYRLNQALEIAQVVEEETIANLIRRIDCSAFDSSDQLLLVVNSLPHPRHEVLDLCVDTPQEDSAWEVDVLDADGARCDVQQRGRRQMTGPVHDLESRPWPFNHDRHMVTVDPGELPAGGYKVLRIAARNQFARESEWWPEMRTSPGGDIAPQPRVLENEHLRVEVNADGTLDMTDKTRNRTVSGMHYFEDSGDIGDYWAHYPPRDNRVFTSQGQQARIWLENNGPLSATLAVEMRMSLPARATMPEKAVIGESSRSDDSVDVTILSRFTLRRGSRRLDVRTTIENTAEDHRMRLMIPSDIRTDAADAAGHFTVDHRPHLPPRDDRGEYWPEMATLPMQMFVDVSDEAQGLAIVSNSFTEYQLLDDARRTVAITLFRAVRNRICTEYRSTGSFPHQKGGQVLRTLDYEYAIYPHDGDWQAGQVFGEALALNVKPVAFQFSAGEGGRLPVEASLFSVEPVELVVSAFKRAEDREAVILRVYNPSSETVEGRVSVRGGMQKAWKLNLNEEREEDLAAASDGALAISIASNEIVTIEIGRRPGGRKESDT
jgi:mannosylglycerate hydrolase